MSEFQFQPLLLSVAPAHKKEHGYGVWIVHCPTCGQPRSLHGYKYKATGKVRGAENQCHPCRAKFLERRVPLKCPGCGVVRMVKPADAAQRLSCYCRRCVKANWGNRRHRNGTRHANKTSRGYMVVVGMTGHPLATRNCVHEHWLTLYEQHPMWPESVLWFRQQRFTVHHKNGVRDDNRLENLELRAPGRHPHGWTIEAMEEVIRHYRNTPLK